MSHLSSVTYPAIKQLLSTRLQAALDLYASNSSASAQLEHHIPLYLVKDEASVVYRSAIAVRLSQVLKMPALEIATALANLLQVKFQPDVNQPDFTVQVVPPSWIHLQLAEPKLAAWLHLILSSSIPCLAHKQRQPLLNDNSRLFAVQYAHARCCSLVQLAHQEGLITLRQTRLDNPSAVWQVVEPNPIPWLNQEQKLWLCHPAERALIDQFLRILDDLYYPCPSHQPTDWFKAAFNLSQTFQTFYSSCRIWGEVKSKNISLAQARLGLVLILQSILRFLLQDRLGAFAPLEL